MKEQDAGLLGTAGRGNSQLPPSTSNRVPSAWSEWGDGHDYSRTGKHDPNECRKCLKVIISRLETQPFADRMVRAEARVSTLVSIARRAVNGWACYAKRKLEHDDIARLHQEISSVLDAQSAESKQEPT